MMRTNKVICLTVVLLTAFTFVATSGVRASPVFGVEAKADSPSAIFEAAVKAIGTPEGASAAAWSQAVEKERASTRAAKADARTALVATENLIQKFGPHGPRLLRASDQEYWTAAAALVPGGERLEWPGAWFARRGTRFFVSDVFAGSSAAKAGLKTGDEIVRADRQAFAPVTAFRQHHPHATFAVEFKRLAFGKPETLKFSNDKNGVDGTILHATLEAAHVYDFRSKKIGYLRIYAAYNEDLRKSITQALARFAKETDGAIVDLRGNFSDADLTMAGLFFDIPADAAEKDPAKIKMTPAVYTKPLVALIDQRTSGGKETLAWLLKSQRRAELVGARTAGNPQMYRAVELLRGEALLLVPPIGPEKKLPDELLRGAEPDVKIDAPLMYAAGADPALDEALKIALQKVRGA